MLNVMSLFDGIAGGYLSLKRAGFKIDNYYASEIDPNCLKVVEKLNKSNSPEIIQIGDVREIDFKKYRGKDINLLLGGSPCQDMSRCGKREGLAGNRSSLFWYYVEALRTLHPKWFLFENVYSMSEEDKQTITSVLNVEPIVIDSAWVSAQHRLRYYWTNISQRKPLPDLDLKVKDIIARDYESKEDSVHFLNRPVDWIPEEKLRKDKFMPLRIGSLSGLKHSQSNRIYSLEGKTVSLVANSGGSGGKTGLYKIDTEDGYILRKLLPIECERAQTLPDNYTKVEGISNTQRYKMINNGWTINVIAHLLRGIGRG